MSARDNLTSDERARQGLKDTYTLGLDLVDGNGHRSRFWFRRKKDREEFGAIFNDLREKHGHTTRAVKAEDEP